jgi:hypothetical protein
LYKGDDVYKLILASGMDLPASSAEMAASLAEPAFEGDAVVLFEFRHTPQQHWILLNNASAVSCSAQEEWLQMLYSACQVQGGVGGACNASEYARLHSLYQHTW